MPKGGIKGTLCLLLSIYVAIDSNPFAAPSPGVWDGRKYSKQGNLSETACKISVTLI